MGLLNASHELLEQLKACLSQFKSQEYSTSLSIFSGSSIGQHTRHILEFYQCLLQQVDEGIINYDLRKRNLSIETDLEIVLEAITDLQQQLPLLTLDNKVILQGTLGGEMNTVASSVSRELLYVIEHSVHHMAILKMGIVNAFPHIKLSTNFGIAESTIKYHKQQCAQ
jgi:uncharacterized damage-inducible protein DinB